MIAGHLALVVAALFTGAAFYINFAEQPARMSLREDAMLAQWKPAYSRGYMMQSSLAAAGFALGALAWWFTGHAAYAIGAALMIANWPWTLVIMMPVNKALEATPPERAGPESRALLQRWNQLHAVRTTLGACAVIAFLSALIT